jgi:hypothetical protein
MPQNSERQIPPVSINNFPGLMTNKNPHQIPPGGALEQVNATQRTDSQLDVRPGTRPISFEN